MASYSYPKANCRRLIQLEGSFNSDISNDRSRSSLRHFLSTSQLFVGESTSTPIFSTLKVPPMKDKKKRNKEKQKIEQNSRQKKV